MLLFEMMAEEKIRDAMAKGELENLPGAGKPIPDEQGLEFVAAEMRMAYRILKNAGFVPEEVQLRREISDVTQLLACCESESTDHDRLHRRLCYLIQKLTESGHNNLTLQADYMSRLTAKFG